MITAIIETRNGEKEILDCIKSARLLTDDIVVIDIASTDKTAALSKKAGAKVFNFPFTPYVEPARQFGIEKAQNNWVLILDTDERLTPELAQEIKSVIKDSKFSHYKIPRKNIFGNKKWLKYGGWWPDPQLRLLNKSFFRSWPKEIHSTPQLEGAGGLLENPLLHYFHGDIESMVAKTAVFEDIESGLLHKAGRSVSTLTFFRKFLGELYRRLLKKLGFLDGTIGIIESIYQAFSKTITYLFLYEKKKSSSL